MVQIKTIVASLLTLSLATCSPMVKRDASVFLADLAVISTSLDSLTTSVQAYTGGLVAALAIANKENALDMAIKKATADATAATPFTVDESSSVVSATGGLVPKIQGALSALTTKEPLFDASGLDPLVLSLLTTLKTDTDNLGTVVQAKAQPADGPALAAYQVTIDAAFAGTIAAYS